MPEEGADAKSLESQGRVASSSDLYDLLLPRLRREGLPKKRDSPPPPRQDASSLATLPPQMAPQMPALPVGTLASRDGTGP
jgi:hypothetical protein